MSTPLGPRISLTCDTCGKIFERRLIDQNRKHRIRKGGWPCRNYCCNTCSHLGQTNRELKPFRMFVYAIRRRMWISKRTASKAKSEILNGDSKLLSALYFKQMWEKQKGICPYTGITMSLQRPGTQPHTASLDRIDPNKGYVDGNVEFVCRFINLGKNEHSKQEILDFISQIKLPPQTHQP